jgi:uncharacterized protein YlxW (UPF0749 family)
MSSSLAQQEAVRHSLEQLSQLSSTSGGHATSALAIASQVQTTVDQVASVSREVATAASAITDRVDQSTNLASAASARGGGGDLGHA